MRRSVFLIRTMIVLAGISSVFSLSKSQTDQLYINEVLASNVDFNLSPQYNEYSDWIELFNSSSSSISLSGFYLSDDPGNVTKWEIPEGIIIEADGYLLFWADGRNSSNHTSFELDKNGEFIGLYNAEGTLIDSVSFGIQRDDTAYGRLVSDPDTWVYFGNPTPGTENAGPVFDGIATGLQFSIPGGFYSGSQVVSLTCSTPSSEIYYTTDGTEPDESSLLYSAPLDISSTSVIRARAFATDMLPGNIKTYTYFIDEEINLPIISISTDPDNLFSDEKGIYVTGTNGVPGSCDQTVRNVNQDWERKVNIEYYEKDGEEGFNQEAGIKIFGGCSRTRYPQKSLALYARNSYGKGAFKHQLFTHKPIDKFEAFLLRSAADDQVRAFMRDALTQNVLPEYMDADIQAYQPVVVFINGEYWGIHNMREKINEHYFAGNFDLDPSEINILEKDGSTVIGSNDSYQAMMDFITSHDMDADENYEYVKTQMEVPQYIDYQIAHIYLSERDWPGNNIKFWSSNSGKHTRWRWLTYDVDQTFTRTWANSVADATEPNGPGWPNPPWSTLLFRELLENEDFKNEFIQTYAYHLSTTMNPDRLIHYIDSFETRIEPEIPRHILKWGGLLDPDFNEYGWHPMPTFNSLEEWHRNVDTLRIFTEERPYVAIQNLSDKFGLTGLAALTIHINEAGSGKVELYNRKIPSGDYTGSYFLNVPVKLKALSSAGHKFSYWTASGPGVEETFTTQEIEIELSDDLLLTAYFDEADINDGPSVIINEISYHPADDNDPGDWLEIYNRSGETIDLTGWTFKDENDDHVFEFPTGTEIETGAYLVLCQDEEDFSHIFPTVMNYTGEFDFGLSNAGEVLRLYDAGNTLVDSVLYDDHAPWPDEPDGNGPTLSLINYNLNNDLPENWGPSVEIGTPGAKNVIDGIIAIPENITQNDKKDILYQNYPNPADQSTYIKYSLAEDGKVKLTVCDIYGRELICPVNARQKADIYTVQVESEILPKGVYFYTLRVNEEIIAIKKMVIVH